MAEYVTVHDARPDYTGEARSEFRARPYQKAEKYSRGHENRVQYFSPPKRHENHARRHDDHVEEEIALRWQEPLPSARSAPRPHHREFHKTRREVIMDGPGQSTRPSRISRAGEELIDIMDGPGQRIRHPSNKKPDEERIEILDGPEQSIQRPSNKSRSHRNGTDPWKPDEERIEILDGPEQNIQRPSNKSRSHRNRTDPWKPDEERIEILDGSRQRSRYLSRDKSRAHRNRTDPLETDEGRIDIMDGPKQSIENPSPRNAPQRGPGRHAYGKGGFQKTYEHIHIRFGSSRDIEHSSSRPRRHIYGGERF